jgi:uncharacterized membrane protein
MESPNKEILEKWHKDPNNWKFGNFYYNKEDKRIFPPKRTAWMGWTVNFANRNSIIAYLFLFGIIILILWFYKPN